MMRQSILILLLILSCNLCFAQPSVTDKVLLQRVAEYEFLSEGFYLKCEKQKTYFDKKEFKENVSPMVPEQILTELQQASLDSNDEIWEEKLFSSGALSSLILKTQCLTKVDCDELFKSTGNRQRIVSISDPIFDLSEENCVVSVVYHNFKDSAFGHSYFLKKIYGQWTIVFTYDHWMT
jgi:hypothetical protein